MDFQNWILADGKLAFGILRTDELTVDPEATAATAAVGKSPSLLGRTGMALSSLFKLSGEPSTFGASPSTGPTLSLASSQMSSSQRRSRHVRSGAAGTIPGQRGTTAEAYPEPQVGDVVDTIFGPAAIMAVRGRSSTMASCSASIVRGGRRSLGSSFDESSRPFSARLSPATGEGGQGYAREMHSLPPPPPPAPPSRSSPTTPTRARPPLATPPIRTGSRRSYPPGNVAPAFAMTPPSTTSAASSSWTPLTPASPVDHGGDQLPRGLGPSHVGEAASRARLVAELGAAMADTGSGVVSTADGVPESGKVLSRGGTESAPSSPAASETRRNSLPNVRLGEPSVGSNDAVARDKDEEGDAEDENHEATGSPIGMKILEQRANEELSGSAGGSSAATGDLNDASRNNEGQHGMSESYTGEGTERDQVLFEVRTEGIDVEDDCQEIRFSMARWCAFLCIRFSSPPGLIRLEQRN